MPPSYFYHLAFELYQPPKPPSSNAAPAYLPPPDTDIFEAELPVHRTTPWGTSPTTKRPSHRRINTESSFSKARSRSFPALNGASRSDLAALKEARAESLDWRFERVSIESIDMDVRLGGSGSIRPRGKSMSQSSSADASTGPSGSSGGGLATRAKFIPADPRNTDIGWGVVHLYREAEETPGLYEEDSFASTSAAGSALAGPFNGEECSTLCILAVPSYMMSSDLLGWAGEQAHEDVSHFRLIRTGKVNRYMVLMKFRDAKKARLWQKEYNGRAFSSMEPEYAHIVFVKSITFQSNGDIGSEKQQSSYPDMKDDPFMPDAQANLKTPTAGPSENPLAKALSTRPLAPPPPNLVELPTCPVCLERMDETTGLLTILCQHVFHCDCLSKWRGSGCPVCRYTQDGPPTSLSGMRPPSAPANEGNNACSVCASDQNSWICLICGNVGCGRYDSAHAFAHFEESGHAYAMDIGSQHVWDYIGDGYVHRLIQNKADGKMVDLPDAAKGMDGGMSAMGADMVPREKMDAMGNEYAYLLQSQLENQRSYFEDQLERAVVKAGKADAAADKLLSSYEAMQQQLQILQASFAELSGQKSSLEKDLERVSRKADKTDTLAKKLAKDWKEEKTVNEGLLERLKVQEDKIKGNDAVVLRLQGEKRDLEEQNHDLSMFISAGEKLQELKEQGEEITDANVEVGKGKGKGRKKR